MSHDLLAELQGYRDELAGAVQYGKDVTAEAVRGQIDRVIEGIKVEVERQLTAAETFEDAGQDVPAAQARVEAKRLARELPEEHRPGKLRALYPDEAGAENATGAAQGKERAVPAKGKPAAKPTPKAGA